MIQIKTRRMPGILEKQPASQPGERATPAPLLHVLLRLVTLRLYLPALLLAAALIGLSGYLYAAMIEREQIQLTRSIAARTDDYLRSAGQSLNTLALLAEDEQLYEVYWTVLAGQTSRPLFDVLYALDANGTVVAVEPTLPPDRIPDFANRPFLANRSGIDGVQISDPFISPHSGALTVHLSRTLSNGGALVGELNLSSLQQTIFDSQTSAQQGQLFFLSDLEGTLVADPLSVAGAQQASLSYLRSWNTARAKPRSQLVLNQSSLVFETQSPLELAGWVVSAEIPLRAALGPYLWITWIALTIFLALWGILIYTLNHIGFKRVVAPLVQLSQSARQLAEEESSNPPDLSFSMASCAELNDLANNFEKMCNTLQRRQAAVEESEQKYRMLIDQSSDAIYVEYRGRFVITNQKFNEMFSIGRDDREITSIGFIQFVAPVSRPLVKDLQRQLLEGQVASLRYEFSARGNDGRDIDLEASASALPYLDGVAIQSILRDITDRKRTEQAEREQRILAEALRDSASALNTTLEVEEVIDRIFSNASKVVPFQAATIMLLETSPGLQARVAANFGYQRRGGQDWLHKHAFTLEEFPNLKRMYESGRPLVIPDTARSPYWTVCPETRWVRSYAGAPIRVQGKVIGFLNLDVDIPNYYNQTHADRLQAFADQAGVAIHNAQLLTDLRKSRDELYNAYETTLEGWSKALELRDYETEGHTRRVMDMTMKLAESYGITGVELIRIRYGTLLHDIGKIGIPDSILFKPGPLDEEEWEVMRRHPVYARRILAHIPYLQDSLEIPYNHHEKWDGSGYPRGLKGEEIPLPARLFAVVDVWDGLRSNRHYRSGWPEEDVVRYIQEQSGLHFDPQVVAIFLKLLEQQNVEAIAQ